MLQVREKKEGTIGRDGALKPATNADNPKGYNHKRQILKR